MKHRFLLSDVCPINLLGRDLLLTFRLNLLSTSEGMKIEKTSQEMSVKLTDQLAVYQWLLNCAGSEELLQFAHATVSPHATCAASVDRTHRHTGTIFQGPWILPTHLPGKGPCR